jgi:cysteine desulfuration protein SufE
MVIDMNSIQNKIIDDFSNCDTWFDTYEYLISRGKSFDSADENLKNDEHSIGGCQSSVWIKAEEKNDKIHYSADSDSLIIKGILSLLLDVVNDQYSSDVVNADLYFLEKIGLRTNLSPSRVNGLNAIVNQIKTKAKDYAHKDID